MFRKLVLATIICTILVPGVVSAYRFSVGGYTDLFSHGVECCIWTDVGEKSQWFIGPHVFGVYYFANQDGDNTGYGFYTLGLRSGFMWRKDEWISPLIGTSAGYTRNSGLSSEGENYGARLFTGLSFAPFDPLSEKVSWLAWLKPVKGLRFTFESGARYHYSYNRHEDRRWNPILEREVVYIETNENSEIYGPDFGFGFSYNW